SSAVSPAEREFLPGLQTEVETVGGSFDQRAVRWHIKLERFVDDGQELEENPELIESCDVALASSKRLAATVPGERSRELKFEPRFEDLPIPAPSLEQRALEREPVRS